ncbi:MAG: hypothetical protein ACRBEE_02125 [Arenicella sp.]
MKNKKRWIALAIIMLLIGGCFGDRMVASVVFQHYCKTLPGLYVYEKVELGDEYFLRRPHDGVIESKKLRESSIYNEKYRFNSQKIQQEYKYVYQEVSSIFPVGPIYKHQASIIRMQDGKLLSEAISLSNKRGWLVRKIEKAFSGGYGFCPTGRDDSNTPLFNKHHSNLLKETFIKGS